MRLRGRYEAEGKSNLRAVTLPLDASFSIFFQSCEMKSGTKSQDSRLIALTSVCVCGYIPVAVYTFRVLVRF